MAPLVLSSIPPVYQRLINALAQVNIAYGFSPIVHEEKKNNHHKHHLYAGERAPDGTVQRVQGNTTHIFDLLHSPQHVLLTFSGNQSLKDAEPLWQEINTFLSHTYNGLVESYLISLQDGDLPLKNALGILSDQDGTLHERYGFGREGGLVLVRPDGYIGFLSHSLEFKVLQAYFQKIFLSTAPLKEHYQHDSVKIN